MEASRSAIVAVALTLSAGLAGPAAATDLQDMSDPWLEPTYQWYGADAEWPDFLVAPRWPQPLPNNWIIGQVGGIAVDRHDNIWILQRARSLDDSEAGATDAYVDPATGEVATGEEDGEEVPIDALGNPRPFGPIAECCLPAPAVLKFDPEGNLLDAWAVRRTRIISAASSAERRTVASGRRASTASTSTITTTSTSPAMATAPAASPGPPITAPMVTC
jgi:hypothetical protein